MLCLLFLGTVQAQKQKKTADQPEKPAATSDKVKATSINLVVVDENGKPMPNAQVVVGEGAIHAVTNAQGILTFLAFPTDFVTISASGYENSVSLVQDIILDNKVKMAQAKLYMTSSDNVPLPFMTVKKRNLTSGTTLLNGSTLEKYPTTDLRNAFAGLVPGLTVIERNGSTGTSAEEKLGYLFAQEKVGMYIRGLSPMWIIDNVPTDITEMQLDPQEIESVTIMKDIVAKTMYGPQAANGCIYVKTKRGKKNEKILNVNMEYGTSFIDRMPGFTNGADYATLNNLARTNSGLAPVYTADNIASYGLNNPYSMKFPSNDYKSMMLKDSKSIQRVNLSSQGGNESVQYFVNMAYDGDGDIYKIGPPADFNRISTRANLDIKINDLIKVQFDFYGGLTTRRSSNYSTVPYVSQLDQVVYDIATISPIAMPVYANNDPSLNKPWYAVSSTFPNNPIGRLLNQGTYTETGRQGNTSMTINYDMKDLLKGLTSKTFVDFQALNVVRLGKNEDYTAYTVTPTLTAKGADSSILTKVHDGIDLSGQSDLSDFSTQRFSIYQSFNYDRTFGKHAIQAAATYYIAKSAYSGIEEPRRTLNAILSANYTFADKLSIQAVGNYAGTYSFSRSKRSALFPAVGLGYVISDESFLKGVKFLDFLKVRAEVGENGYEAYVPPYYYNTVFTYNTSGTKFGPAPTTYWFGSSEDKSQYQTFPSRIGNPDLTWETRKEYSVGLEALMFKKKLSVDVSYYNNLRDGIVTQISNSKPYTAGLSGAIPWFNYNKTRYTGIESAIQYTDKIGNLQFSIGGNITTQASEVVKLDEPNYRFPYQSQVGQSANALYGLVCIGKFATDAETLVVPQLFDATLHAGDLKYKDINGDGVIDAQDKVKIGDNSPKLFYGINLHVAYNGFDMTVTGSGRALYDIPMTNRYFQNGWGDNNYSNFVKNNIGGAYPKLTYYQVVNNFQFSNFWLMKGGFFKIKDVELAYTLPQQVAYKLHTRGVRFFVRGANLLTITKVKDVDPESVDSGIYSYPLFRTFSAGLKLTF
jgi:TonB-linked SusC/RagA family outer membrane protein